jgi:hypothetical protein
MSQTPSSDRVFSQILQLQGQRLSTLTETTKTTSKDVAEIHEQLRQISRAIAILDRRVVENGRNTP